jgi:hypothetical protein
MSCKTFEEYEISQNFFDLCGNHRVRAFNAFNAGASSRDEEIKQLKSLLTAVVNSEAVKEAPMLSYSEAYINAVEYLKKT